MKNTDFLVYEKGEIKSADLCEFMSINYDITDLANKIYAAKYLKLHTLNLKKNNLDIA